MLFRIWSEELGDELKSFEILLDMLGKNSHDPPFPKSLLSDINFGNVRKQVGHRCDLAELAQQGLLCWSNIRLLQFLINHQPYISKLHLVCGLSTDLLILKAFEHHDLVVPGIQIHSKDSARAQSRFG